MIKVQKSDLVKLPIFSVEVIMFIQMIEVVAENKMGLQWAIHYFVAI